MKFVSGRKFFSATIVLSVLLFPSVTGATVVPEGFFDLEKNEKNLISSGTLDFSLASSADFSPAVTLAQPSKREIEVKKEGNLGFKYQVKTSNYSGELCDNLKLKMKFSGGSEQHSDNLKTFQYKIGLFSSPAELEFTAEISGSGAGLEGKKCDFDFVFEGWQENFANFGDGGFSDIEKIHNSISCVGEIVLNEIFPDPSGTDNSDKDHSEFVELYNNSNSSKDVGGWRIYIRGSEFIEIDDNTTDGKGTTISAGGFLVVYLSKKWNSSKLNNTSDSVSLYKGTKTSSDLVDNYDYSEAQMDKSFARQPNGIGNWVLSAPTPGS